MKKVVEYTPTEQMLLDEVSFMDEISECELESLADDIDRNGSMWVAVELGRCPSTDRRTYILHTSNDKPQFDYYGAELYKKGK